MRNLNLLFMINCTFAVGPSLFKKNDQKIISNVLLKELPNIRRINYVIKGIFPYYNLVFNDNIRILEDIEIELENISKKQNEINNEDITENIQNIFSISKMFSIIRYRIVSDKIEQDTFYPHFESDKLLKNMQFSPNEICNTLENFYIAQLNKKNKQLKDQGNSPIILRNIEEMQEQNFIYNSNFFLNLSNSYNCAYFICNKHVLDKNKKEINEIEQDIISIFYKISDIFESPKNESTLLEKKELMSMLFLKTINEYIKLLNEENNKNEKNFYKRIVDDFCEIFTIYSNPNYDQSQNIFESKEKLFLGIFKRINDYIYEFDENFKKFIGIIIPHNNFFYILHLIIFFNYLNQKIIQNK